MYQLGAVPEILFTELPFVERVRRLHELGFAVQIWRWEDKNLDALAATGARITSMVGYQHGDLYDAERGKQVVETAKPAIEAAARIGCRNLIVHGAEFGPDGALRPRDVITGEMWLAAYRNLERLADLADEAGVTFCLENLNLLVDHPGVPFGRAEDALTLVAAVDRPGVKLMLDLYHAQVGEGNLVELIRKAAPHVAEVQVADVPGRHEPGTGEVNWPVVARALDEVGFEGVVGLEAWPVGDSLAALEAFRSAFTLPARA
jgi:hydroxypyruvate isomerase